MSLVNRCSPEPSKYAEKTVINIFVVCIFLDKHHWQICSTISNMKARVLREIFAEPPLLRLASVLKSKLVFHLSRHNDRRQITARYISGILACHCSCGAPTNCLTVHPSSSIIGCFDKDRHSKRSDWYVTCSKSTLDALFTKKTFNFPAQETANMK